MTVLDKVGVDDDRMTLVRLPDSIIVSILQDITIVSVDECHITHKYNYSILKESVIALRFL